MDEDGSKEKPYLILRRDRAPILCAAIGQYPSAGREPTEYDGFVIITADSAGGMVDIHDQRPVALSPDLAFEWLDPVTTKERAEEMVLPQGAPEEVFEWFRIKVDTGNVRNQSADLIKPMTDSF